MQLGLPHFLATRIKQAMATHGSTKAFNPAVDDWSAYVKRLQHYFAMNGVTDDEPKASILFTLCGIATYKLL